MPQLLNEFTVHVDLNFFLEHVKGDRTAAASIFIIFSSRSSLANSLVSIVWVRRLVALLATCRVGSEPSRFGLAQGIRLPFGTALRLFTARKTSAKLSDRAGSFSTEEIARSTKLEAECR
jgi:hypothetical protein